MWKLFCTSPYLLSFDSAFLQGIWFSLPVSLAELIFTAVVWKWLHLWFKDLIRAGMVIIITAVTTTAAAVMVSLCSTLQKETLT